jgi:2-polyprenyl-3-methyl-5-hydroxy-6-metoxy-1,4-benzoquinol methylase
METPEIICPICRNTGFTEVLRLTDHFVTGEVFPLLKCKDCGFLITGNVPVNDEMERYYKSDDYISHSDTSTGLINRVYHTVRNLMLQKKFNIVKHATAKANGKLLDIGAGTGYFLNYAQKKGWEITGTEKSNTARLFAQQRWNLTIYPENQIYNLGDEYFDAITLWHVLEHLPDPDNHWKVFHRILKKEGRVIIALPNFESADAKHYGEHWAAWDVPRHLWHFSPDHIRRMAENSGFTLVDMHRMPFDSFYISMLSEKYKKSPFPSVKGIFIGKLSWILSLINIKKCSSVIYIFKKE